MITGLNLWGVSESAKVFTVPTVQFIVAIAAVIAGGLSRTQPAVPLDHHVGAATEAAHRYAMIGALLELGKMPKPPSKKKSLVVVPVASMSQLTSEGISAALSLGDDVVAVTVCFADPEDEAADVSFRYRWEEWHPNVPLITLRTAHRSITRPIVKYLCQIEATDNYHRLVVLIPEVQPPKFWEYLLFNQRGAILDHAIRHGTANVVLCRLRYRLEQFAPAIPPRRSPLPRPRCRPGRVR